MLQKVVKQKLSASEFTGADNFYFTAITLSENGCKIALKMTKAITKINLKGSV